MHQRRGVQAEAGAEGRRREAGERAWRGREAGEPPTHSIADGTALHRGEVKERGICPLRRRPLLPFVGRTLRVAATFERSRIRPRGLLFV